MFEVFCPTHGCRVLLSAGRIEHLHNTGTGMVVTWRCWCGHRGHHRTGRAGSAAPRPVGEAQVEAAAEVESEGLEPVDGAEAPGPREHPAPADRDEASGPRSRPARAGGRPTASRAG